MNFIKYLLKGIINCFDAFVGKSSNDVSIKQALFGLLFIAMTIILFFVFLFFIDKTFGLKVYLNIIIAIFLTILIICLIFAIFIIAEKIT